MVTKTITTRCDYCGKDFETTKEFPTPEMANQWAKIAVKHYRECPECFKNGCSKDDRITFTQHVAIQSEQYGLPQLTGTEKQIAWGNSVRMKYFEDFSVSQDEYTDCGVDFWLYVFENTTNSLDWIANRENIIPWARKQYGEDFVTEHPEYKGQKMKKETKNEQ